MIIIIIKRNLLLLCLYIYRIYSNVRHFITIVFVYIEQYTISIKKNIMC